MNEIPFVNALGDAIEHSAATRIAGRRGRIRRRIGSARRARDRRSGVAAASGVFTAGSPGARHVDIGCYSAPTSALRRDDSLHGRRATGRGVPPRATTPDRSRPAAAPP